MKNKVILILGAEKEYDVQTLISEMFKSIGMKPVRICTTSDKTEFEGFYPPLSRTTFEAMAIDCHFVIVWEDDEGLYGMLKTSFTEPDTDNTDIFAFVNAKEAGIIKKLRHDAVLVQMVKDTEKISDIVRSTHGYFCVSIEQLCEVYEFLHG